MNFKRPYKIISNLAEQTISFRNEFILTFSVEFLIFLNTYPQLTFDGAVALKKNDNYLIYSFCSLFNIMNIFNDEAWIEHFQYLNILNSSLLIPFGSGLTWDYFYFIGAGKDNLNNIYIFDNNTQELTKIADNIDEFFNDKINFDLKFG